MSNNSGQSHGNDSGKNRQKFQNYVVSTSRRPECLSEQVSTTITTSGPMEPKSCQPVFITFLDGFTWLTTGSHQAVKSSRCTQQEPNGTQQCHRPAASLRAPRGKLAAYHTVIIHILWAKIFRLPSLKQVSFLKTGGHPICRHNTPSRTLKIHEKWLGLLNEGSTRGESSNPVSHRPVDNKQNIRNVSFFPNLFEKKMNEWITFIHSIFSRQRLILGKKATLINKTIFLEME